MFSPTRTALYVAIGAMALAANEANAGCKLIGGTYVCASWITGSEICQVVYDTQTTNPNPANVSIECSVEGAIVTPTEGGGVFVCTTGQLPPGTLTCGPGLSATTSSSLSSFSMTAAATTGTGIAKNECKHGNDVGADGHTDLSCFDSSLGIFPPPPPGGLSAFATDIKCDQQGICTGSAEVNPPAGSTCNANGGPVINFTADQFVGTVDACSGESCRTLSQLCTRNGEKYDCTTIPPPSSCSF